MEPEGMSESLRNWAYSPDRESIWVVNDKNTIILGMSSEFLRVVRPIFLKAYEVLYVDQGTHTRLADVYVPPTGVSRPSNPPENVANVIVTSDHIYQDILSLEKLMTLLVDIEPPLGVRDGNPPILDQFLSLCNYAFPEQSVAELRYWVYFITKNPLIFTATESMTFIQKSWNLRKMDLFAFDAVVRMLELTDYIERVDAAMEELNYVKCYQISYHADPYAKTTSIYYAENVKRHFQDAYTEDSYGYRDYISRKTTLKRIYDTALMVLYDVVPYAFRDMAWGFYNRPHKFPLHPDMDLIGLLEDEPYVIVPRHLCPQ